jgi:hypothetical protein
MKYHPMFGRDLFGKALRSFQTSKRRSIHTAIAHAISISIKAVKFGFSNPAVLLSKGYKELGRYSGSKSVHAVDRISKTKRVKSLDDYLMNTSGT